MLRERADHQPASLARGAFGAAGVVLGAAPGLDVAGAGVAGLVGDQAMDKQPKIPAWMKDLPDNATIGNLEMCEIYGMHKGSMVRCVESGAIPAPKFVVDRPCGKKKLRWRLGDIRRHVRSIVAEQNKGFK